MPALAADHTCHSTRHRSCSHSCSTTIAEFHFTCCLTISSGDHESPLLSGTKSPTPVRLQRATNRLDQVLTRRTCGRLPIVSHGRPPSITRNRPTRLPSGSGASGASAVSTNSPISQMWPVTPSVIAGIVLEHGSGLRPSCRQECLLERIL